MILIEIKIIARYRKRTAITPEKKIRKNLNSWATFAFQLNETLEIPLMQRRRFFETKEIRAKF